MEDNADAEAARLEGSKGGRITRSFSQVVR